MYKFSCNTSLAIKTIYLINNHLRQYRGLNKLMKFELGPQDIMLPKLTAVHFKYI